MILFALFVSLSSAINCTDFVVSTNTKYGPGGDIKTIFTPRGQAQCEEECRKLVECASYSMQKFGRRSCILKRETSSIDIKPGWLSGVKSITIDHGGNVFDINYCRHQQRVRQCPREPSCTNYCPIGYKRDQLGCMVSCECHRISDPVSEENYVFGDLKLSEQQIKDKLTYNDNDGEIDSSELRGVDIRVARWTTQQSGGKYLIPYTKNRLPAGAHSALNAGIRALEQGTCLRFVQRTNQRDYMDFFVGGGCYSQVGRVGGRQEVSLGNGCWYSHTVSHEIMHALGFWHEQMRPDRDSYVNVYLNNVSPGMRFNFNKLNPSQWNSFGQAYDITSVMQYHGTAFSMNGQATMIDKKTNRPIPWNTRVSASDYAQLNSLYPCTDSKPTPKPTNRPSTKTTRPTGTCVDTGEHCAYWAKTGECQKNAAYMHESCKVSCGLCSSVKPTPSPTTRPTPSCQDTNQHCRSWASSGYCTSNAAYMSTNCCRSCGGGGGGSNCRDTNQYCASWASTGECQRNPAYMSKQCRRSCRHC